MKKILILTLFIIIIASVFSSQLYRLFAPSTIIIEKPGKRITFIGMVHIAPQSFYDDVINKVVEEKRNGSWLYYEEAMQSGATDIELRKLRKFIGFLPSGENYAEELAFFTKIGFVPQKNTQFISLVNNNDVVADMTAGQMITAYESKYGNIVLTSNDTSTTLSEKTPDTLPYDQTEDIIMNVRTRYLADLINSSTATGIILLYGENHYPLLLEELKKIDINWNETNR